MLRLSVVQHTYDKYDRLQLCYSQSEDAANMLVDTFISTCLVYCQLDYCNSATCINDCSEYRTQQQVSVNTSQPFLEKCTGACMMPSQIHAHQDTAWPGCQLPITVIQYMYSTRNSSSL